LSQAKVDRLFAKYTLPTIAEFSAIADRHHVDYCDVRATALVVSLEFDSSHSAFPLLLSKRMEALQRVVYILKNTDNPPRFYTGVTADLRPRLEAHNCGRCAHTAKFRPSIVDALIKFADERRAVAFEKYLKSVPA
jgi:predicted GIY-YIG superfamily endonuclease